MEIRIGTVTLRDASVTLSYDMRIDRKMQRDAQGDDLTPLGRHSKEFEVTSTMSLESFLQFEKDTATGEAQFVSAFGEYKVIVKRVRYAPDGTLTLLLVEDVE